ncbi:MAG: hypothetical protein JWR09_4510 [Mucilaginibacter sp.]|nr:hypothetical protein [Mucilaginibacter sp.]
MLALIIKSITLINQNSLKNKNNKAIDIYMLLPLNLARV